MGLKPQSKTDNRYFNTPDIFYKYDTGEYRITNTATPESMKYHSSWDWLMPVVEKIEALEIGDTDMSVEIEGHNCLITLTHHDRYHKYVAHDSKINAVYASAVAFIQWYNQNK